MEILFNWVGGATFVITIGDLKIAVDPVLCSKGTVQNYFWFKSKRIEEPIYDDKTFENIDLWLITHNHEDHLDILGLSKISDTSNVITNMNSAKKIEDIGNNHHSILDWQETKEYEIKGYYIKVEAIPAIHGVNPLSARLAGRVNGYFVTITKGKDERNIYITSDTVYKNKVISSVKNRKIDLLIPNMGAAKEGSWIMTLTLNARMLQKMIAQLNPSLVIPVHYGTFRHYVEPVEKIEALNDSRIVIVDVGSKIKINL